MAVNHDLDLFRSAGLHAAHGDLRSAYRDDADLDIGGMRQHVPHITCAHMLDILRGNDINESRGFTDGLRGSGRQAACFVKEVKHLLFLLGKGCNIFILGKKDGRRNDAKSKTGEYELNPGDIHLKSSPDYFLKKMNA